MEALERRFLKQAREEWRGITPNKPKLSTYMQIRDLSEMSCMVNLNLPRYQRSIVSRLLCGILPLEVEVGRYKKKNKKKIPREERYCKVCNKKEVEDEVHFVMSCEKLEGQRKEFIEPLLDSEVENAEKSKIEKLKWLLSRKVLSQSARGIEALFKERQSQVYKKKSL